MNRKGVQKRVELLALIVEGVGLRSASRICKLAKNTVWRFKQRMAATCLEIHESRVRGVRPTAIQCDEVWTVVRGREPNRTDEWRESDGNTWIWAAMDHSSRLLISWLAAKRRYEYADTFFRDVADRCDGEFVVLTDGYFSYPLAIEAVFYDRPGVKHQSVAATPRSGTGAHTNYIERHNSTMRQSMSVMRRDGLMFAKSIAGLNDALSIHMVYYNFVRSHKSLGRTPAMAAGIATAPITLLELVELDIQRQERERSARNDKREATVIAAVA